MGSTQSTWGGHRTVDIVRRTSYVGHRTLDIVRWTLYVGHRTLDIVRWTSYVGHRTVDIVRWTSRWTGNPDGLEIQMDWKSRWVAVGAPSGNSNGKTPSGKPAAAIRPSGPYGTLGFQLPM